MYAVIDIGSNTMRLSVYKVEDTIKTMFHKKEMVGLAGYVEDGMLSEAGIDKAIATLLSFRKIIENICAQKVFVIATASLRNITNTRQAVEKIKKETQFDINVISGDEEAELGFIGATHNVDTQSGILIDIGGGSTEIVFYQNGKVEKTCSMPIGSLNLYAKFVEGIIPTKEECKKIKAYVKQELEKTGTDDINSEVICGVGGTARAIRKLYNDIHDFDEQNNSIPIRKIKKIMNDVYRGRGMGIHRILQIAPDRVHTLIPGIIIVKTIAKKFGGEMLIVSDYGVREGYLYKMLTEEKA
ncbi:MAG: phosphatase [Clostridia bacterium]|nr:phosphatase [Clostridia bacterium]